ncbi:MAG: protein-disulfide reductase DsbD domain-containing protein [Verrucomicrobiota bacterium]
MIFASSATVSFAGVRSGKAEADWISTTKSYEAGKPLQTAVRLVVDEAWHTYWLNPGEGGMKISAVWELPAGWTAGELEHPVPKRFMTGDLPGFGYEGTVVFPVKFTPPAGFTEPAKLKGKISCLTCNDDKCVPGNAELELSLVPGKPIPTDEATLIDAALLKIPRQNPEIKLVVIESPKTLTLTLISATTKPFDPSDYEFFPTTPQVVDAAAKFEFTNNHHKWTAEVAKSEYAAQAIEELTLVLAGKAEQPPMALTWTAGPPKSH